MEKLACVLDNFVYALKENPIFSGVRFIHGGRNMYAEKPVTSFLVACSVQSESVVSNREVSGKLELVVYAPSGESKRPLTDLCENIARAVKGADKDRVTQEILVESASFDSNLTVWRQRVIVKVSLFESAHSAEEAMISICGKDMACVTDFSVVKKADYHVIKELLGGDTGERVRTGVSCTLNLTSQGSEDIFASLADGEITVRCAETGEEYLGCVVEKSTLKFVSSHPVREYVILCVGGGKSG